MPQPARMLKGWKGGLCAVTVPVEDTWAGPAVHACGSQGSPVSADAIQINLVSSRVCTRHTGRPGSLALAVAVEINPVAVIVCTGCRCTQPDFAWGHLLMNLCVAELMVLRAAQLPWQLVMGSLKEHAHVDLARCSGSEVSLKGRCPLSRFCHMPAGALGRL